MKRIGTHRTSVSLGIPAAAVLAGWLLGWIFSPLADGTYLALQARSDPVHRLAVLVLPSSIAILLLAGLLMILLRKRPWIQRTGFILGSVSLCVLVGIITCVARFDSRIEAAGDAGQFEMGPVPQGTAAEPPLGPFIEEEDDGIASSPLQNGDAITLDHRTVARKTSSGQFRWNQPRPVRKPSTFWIASDTLLVAGPGPSYEDDVMVAAFDLQTGQRRWSFHCLGDKILSLDVKEKDLWIATERPGVVMAHLLRWTTPVALQHVAAGAK
jgi:hypothetical protein